MKRTYQIDERKAIEKFRSYLVTNPGSIQMVLPLAEVAQRLRHGVSQMLFQTERELLGLIMVIRRHCGSCKPKGAWRDVVDSEPVATAITGSNPITATSSGGYARCKGHGRPQRRGQ